MSFWQILCNGFNHVQMFLKGAWVYLFSLWFHVLDPLLSYRSFWGLLSSPEQFYYVHDLMSWSQAQSYYKQKYTDLGYLDKLEASRPLLACDAWIGGYDMKSGYSDSQNITESENTTTLSTNSNCLTLDVISWKRVKRGCRMTFSFYCSRGDLSAF